MYSVLVVPWKIKEYIHTYKWWDCSVVYHLKSMGMWKAHRHVDKILNPSLCAEDWTAGTSQCWRAPYPLGSQTLVVCLHNWYLVLSAAWWMDSLNFKRDVRLWLRLRSIVGPARKLIKFDQEIESRNQLSRVGCGPHRDLSLKSSFVSV